MKGKDSAERAPQYVKDFQLAEWGHQALFYEYLEMVIQVVRRRPGTRTHYSHYHAVWIHHHLCLRLPSSSFLCTLQQCL